MKVWGLFSIANAYDQPDNNLEKLWKNEPTFQDVLGFIGVDYSMYENMIKGFSVRHNNNKDYRIDEIEVIENENNS